MQYLPLFLSQKEKYSKIVDNSLDCKISFVYNNKFSDVGLMDTMQFNMGITDTKNTQNKDKTQNRLYYVSSFTQPYTCSNIKNIQYSSTVHSVHIHWYSQETRDWSHVWQKAAMHYMYSYTTNRQGEGGLCLRWLIYIQFFMY